MLSGERDPNTLAAFSHPGIHATRDTIARTSLRIRILLEKGCGG